MIARRAASCARLRAFDGLFDAIEAAADASDLYGSEQPSWPAAERIELAALGPLRDVIHRLENRSDEVHGESAVALIGQSDVGHMLTWKQIYDTREQISDRCDAADAVQFAVGSCAQRLSSRLPCYVR